MVAEMNRDRPTDPQDLLSLQGLIDKIFLLTKRIQTLEKLSLEELDAIETRLQIAAATLRGYRNSRRPIHQLPPEIMTDIFSLTRPNLPSFCPWEVAIDNYKERSRKWLSFLNVCRRWRGIIAMSPTLWSTIVDQKDAETFLRRSRDAPFTLNVILEDPKELSAATLDCLASHKHRMSQLHFFHSDTPLFLNHPFITQPASELSSLTIAPLNPVGDMALPQLFAGRTPNLRQLSLRYFTSWPPGYFHNLTHFYLYVQPEQMFRPSTTTFLDFLEQSPLLEVLTLADAGPTKEETIDLPPVALDRMVTLSALKVLNMSVYPAFACARLLAHLLMSNQTEIYILGVAPLIGPEEDLTSLIPSQISHLNNLSSIKECVISRLRDSLYQPGTIHHFLVANYQLQIQTSFSIGQFAPFHRRYPIANIRKFTVNDPSYHVNGSLSTQMWKDCFSNMPVLEAIHILSSLSANSFTKNIVTALQSDGARSSTSFLCPILEEIRIDNEYELPTLRLYNLVKQRSKYGAAIKRLIISYDEMALDSDPAGADTTQDLGSFTEEDVESLARHVGEMVFQDHQTPVELYPPSFGSSYMQSWRRFNSPPFLND
ncbi:hypothetical protein C8J56DRAFT_1078083 [Mycena floridula]|nr:hypothetical protein C8J56DRAFT_1078083 [Mycena floridula]